MVSVEKVNALMSATQDAVEQCVTDMDKWPAFNSAHEGFSILMEEVDELWDEVKKKQTNRTIVEMRKEALQVAAMALRFAVEVCNEETIRK